MELFYKSKDLKARTSPKPFLDCKFLHLLYRITRFISLCNLRLELVLSPIIADLYYKRVLNDNPYTKRQSLY
jgi:hypothetical protein